MVSNKLEKAGRNRGRKRVAQALSCSAQGDGKHNGLVAAAYANPKKALVTGITGQDGAYLAQLLLDKGYQVTGTYRRASSVNFWRIEELGIDATPMLRLLEYDLTDMSSSVRLMHSVEPEAVYNLASGPGRLKRN